MSRARERMYVPLPTRAQTSSVGWSPRVGGRVKVRPGGVRVPASVRVRREGVRGGVCRGVQAEQGQFVQLDGPCGQVDVFACAGGGVGALAVHLDGAVLGRDLHLRAEEGVEGGLHAPVVEGGDGAFLADGTFGVEGGGARAEADPGEVVFGVVLHELHEFGAVLCAQHEDAGGERVEGARVSDAAGVEGAAGAGDHVV